MATSPDRPDPAMVEAAARALYRATHAEAGMDAPWEESPATMISYYLRITEPALAAVVPPGAVVSSPEREAAIARVLDVGVYDAEDNYCPVEEFVDPADLALIRGGT